MAAMGWDKNACKVLENLKEGDHLEASGVGGRVSILERWDGRLCTGVGAYGGLL